MNYIQLISIAGVGGVVRGYFLFKPFRSGVLYSVKKSLKLKLLQAKLAPYPNHPPNQTIDEMFKGFLKPSMPKELLDEYLDEYIDFFCLNDRKISPIVKHYGLSKDNLKSIYRDLCHLPLGWARGHYIPLSTLSYVEPFMYYIQAKQRGAVDVVIVADLFGYWDRNQKLTWRPIA